MKRSVLIASAFALALAGCGDSTTVAYDVTFDVEDPAQRAQLLQMTEHVVQSRLESMGETTPIAVKAEEGGAEVTVSVSDPLVADVLTGQLTEPFLLEVMKETTAEQADITVNGHGSFMKTGITGMHITWIQAQAQQGSDRAMVTIGFTDEGRTLMQALFKENKGKFVGVFVRGKLISKLRVETDELKDDIVIQDIPSLALATVFADDVNVGLHATFVPKP